MYSLTDERVMYVPPIVRDKLIELGIRRNDQFSICKAERREGNRRFIEWVVRRIEAEQPYPPVPVNAGNQTAVVASSAANTPAGAGGNGTAKPNGRQPLDRTAPTVPRLRSGQHSRRASMVSRLTGAMPTPASTLSP